MKKTITTLAVFLTLLAVEAQASQLFLRTNTFRAKAIISGQVYHPQNGEFQVSQLQPGRHFVRVLEKQGNRNRQSGNRGHNNYNNNLIFQGKIFIPQQSNVFARITPRGRLIIDEVVPIRRGNNRQGNRQQSCTPRNNTRQGGGYDYGHNGTRQGGNRDVRQPARGSAQSNFDLALRSVRLASFDSQKKTVAKQYLRNNDVTSQEVLALIREFDFESSRLEIAKFAYRSTIDPHNYFVVNQGFDFNSSVDALNRFIR